MNQGISNKRRRWWNMKPALLRSPRPLAAVTCGRMHVTLRRQHNWALALESKHVISVNLAV